uniref:Uncharacterized protein n=1 Tax=Cannabis sativa TaxID=3483 RepID=A0A803QQ66_CANSA
MYFPQVHGEELNLINQYSFRTCDPTEDYFEGNSHYNIPNDLSHNASSQDNLTFLPEKSLALPSQPRVQETTATPKSIDVLDRLGRQRDLCETLTRRRLVEVGACRGDLNLAIEVSTRTQTTTHGVNRFDNLAPLVKGIITLNFSEFKLDREQHSLLSDQTKALSIAAKFKNPSWRQYIEKEDILSHIHYIEV